MEPDREEQIRARAYQIWEAEGCPEGGHVDHWLRAEQEIGSGASLHPGMLGDGTEEQNLNQAGDPGARITEEEVKDAFKSGATAAKAKS